MLKYKDDYKVVKNKDKQGNIVNKDDTYIYCRKSVQIYRYNDNTLTVQFNTRQYTKNRIKELSELGIQLTPFQIGDNERTYTFSESDFPTIAEVVKAKKRIKRELTDEQREILSLRMKNIIHSKNDIK